MQPCDRTVAQKFSEIAQDLGFWTQKCTIYHCFSFFWSFFKKHFFFSAHFVCAKLSNRNIGRAKKIAFRKSGYRLIKYIFSLNVLEHFIMGQLFSDARNFLHRKTVSMEEVRKNSQLKIELIHWIWVAYHYCKNNTPSHSKTQ